MHSALIRGVLGRVPLKGLVRLELQVVLQRLQGHLQPRAISAVLAAKYLQYHACPLALLCGRDMPWQFLGLQQAVWPLLHSWGSDLQVIPVADLHVFLPLWQRWPSEQVGQVFAVKLQGMRGHPIRRDAAACSAALTEGREAVLC